MKGMKQKQLAERLGISKSYLSMILSGQRQCPTELMEKLQSVHKVHNSQLWNKAHNPKVVGSNPTPATNPIVKSKYP